MNAEMENIAIIRSQVEEAIKNKDYPVEVDCANLEFISSSTVDVIVKLCKELALENQKIVLVNVSEHLREMLTAFHVNELVQIKENDIDILTWEDRLNRRSIGMMFDWGDLFQAFIRGAMEYRANPGTSVKNIKRSADCYCKMIQLEKCGDKIKRS